MNIRKNIRLNFLSNTTTAFLNIYISILIYLIFLFSPFLSSAQKKESRVNFGKASFYHDSFNGKETSNGETYDKDGNLTNRYVARTSDERENLAHESGYVSAEAYNRYDDDTGHIHACSTACTASACIFSQ